MGAVPDAAFAHVPTGKLRAVATSPNGKCPGCGRRVRRPDWKTHHCHECGVTLAEICNDCNLSLTEHAITHWGRLAELHDHDCQPPLRLFGLEEPDHRKDRADNVTRQMFLSNGGGDGRYVSISLQPGCVTVEQFAVICGINTGTARDIARGRHGPAIGKKIDGTWLIPHTEVLAHLEKRWNMQ